MSARRCRLRSGTSLKVAGIDRRSAARGFHRPIGMRHIAIRVTGQRLGVVTEFADHVRGGLGGGPGQAGYRRGRVVDAAQEFGGSAHGVAQGVGVGPCA